MKVISKCPHCGCNIYSNTKDSRNLPVPEYICNCRILSAYANQVYTNQNILPWNPWGPLKITYGAQQQ